jgi:hypothetical protein
MGIVTRIQCDVCGEEVPPGGIYLAINRTMVAEMPAGSGSGRIVIDDLEEPVQVCGQKCYHQWHARKLAEFYEPKRESEKALDRGAVAE